MADIDSGLRDIAEIRSIMERSTKFLSLSGFAGVCTGLVALTGAWAAWAILQSEGVVLEYSASGIVLASSTRNLLVLLGVGVLSLALGIAWYFSRRLIRQQGGSEHPQAMRYLVLALAVPVFVGAFLVLLLLAHGILWLAAPSMLLFYGLGLFSAGTFTFGEVRMLGVLEILLGLAAAITPAYGLFFWAGGFGVLHIVYGALFFRKYGQ